MKNKKRILMILLSLIIVVALMLIITLVVGEMVTTSHNNFIMKVEEATCEYATKEHISVEFCETESYKNLCDVHFLTLINKGYIEENIENPFNKKVIKDDQNSYVHISWKGSEPHCTYKEG